LSPNEIGEAELRRGDSVAGGRVMIVGTAAISITARPRWSKP